jgi:hypothetical protein
MIIIVATTAQRRPTPGCVNRAQNEVVDLTIAPTTANRAFGRPAITFLLTSFALHRVDNRGSHHRYT